MAIRTRQRSLWKSILLLVVAACVWGLDQWKKSQQPADSRREAPASRTPGGSQAPAPSTPPKPSSGKMEKQGGYEVYRGCTLVTEKHNDGDSFEVKLPDGRNVILRLYFVDTPESAFKRYGGGETNAARIRDQAAAMGGITPEQAVEIGQKAKTYTLGVLAKPFDIYTNWDSPYHDERYHAFIRILDGKQPEWLHERLVERGFCRIFTKPADLPDGTPAETHRKALREMERKAKQANAGAWGL